MNNKGLIKKLIWILSTIFIIIIAIVITEKNRARHIEEILDSPGYSKGVFKELKYEKGKNMLGVYSFEANGFPFENSKGFGTKYEKSWKYLLGKTFPVIYNLKDPTKCRILVFPSDFSDFKLKYPDSLNWVKQLIE